MRALAFVIDFVTPGGLSLVEESSVRKGGKGAAGGAGQRCGASCSRLVDASSARWMNDIER